MSTILAKVPWVHFARKSGPSGEAWVNAFEAYSDMMLLSQRALNLLRVRQLREGYRCLEECREKIDQTSEMPMSMCAALDRNYYGISAYYSYCVGEFDEALRKLDHATSAVARAVENQRFLILLAMDCTDLLLQRARVERNRGDRSQMLFWVHRLEAVSESLEPLCVLLSGEQIFLFNCAGFLNEFKNMCHYEHDLIREVLDQNVRRTALQLSIKKLVTS